MNRAGGFLRIGQFLGIVFLVPLVFLPGTAAEAEPFVTNAAAGEFFQKPLARKPVQFEGVGQRGIRRARKLLPLDQNRKFPANQSSALEAALEASGLFSRVVVEETATEYRCIVNVRQQIIEITATGLREFTVDELRRISRIRLGSYLDSIDFTEVTRRIQQAYEEKAFRRVEVKVEQQPTSSEFFTTLHFDISEGYQSKIISTKVRGELPDVVADIPQRLKSDAIGLAASKENLENLRRNVLTALRREGFLQATVSAPIRRLTKDRLDYSLIFEIETGEPLTLVFLGNTVLSTEQLLAPLRIESRTVPFTPGAISALNREIENIYRERGYYDVEVFSTELEPEGRRKIFRITVKEGKLFRAQKINFRGNRIFSDEALRKRIKTQAAGWWGTRRWVPGIVLPSQLAVDIEQIRDVYAEAGFFDVQVQAEVIRRENDEWLTVEFVLDEGPQRLVQEVELVWKNILNQTLPEELLAMESKVEVGEPFSRPRLRDEQRRLYDLLQSQGYPNSSVELSGDRRTGAVRFVIDAGQRVRLGAIDLSGLVFTKDFIIERELLIQPGEYWNSGKVEQSQQAIAELGLFREVQIVPTDGVLDEAEENISVLVRERPTGRFEVGSAFTTEDGLHLFGELGQRNLLGRSQRLRLGVDGYIKTGSEVLDAASVRLGYAVPRIFNSNSSFLSEIFYQSNTQIVDEYSFDRYGASVGIQRRFDEKFLLTIGAIGYRDSLYDVNPDIVIDARDTTATVYLYPGIALDIDLRDNRLSPTSGYRSVFDFRVATEELVSDVSIMQSSWRQSFLQPVSSRVLWANSVTLEALETFGTTEVVPLSQRLFLGGQNSLRGFSKNAVGPRGATGAVVGGDRAFSASTEVRYAFTETLSGVVFLDAGQAFLVHEGSYDGESKDFGDLRFSPGFGAHYNTPIGPIRGELGFPLDREFGEGSFRINISIGTAY